MIRVIFIKNGKIFSGFECSGHSMTAPRGGDIVCAAVSSACLMAANTVTEVAGLRADADCSDGYLRFMIRDNAADAQVILNGLMLHLTELAKDYPDNINITISEV